MVDLEKKNTRGNVIYYFKSAIEIIQLFVVETHFERLLLECNRKVICAYCKLLAERIHRLTMFQSRISYAMLILNSHSNVCLVYYVRSMHALTEVLQIYLFMLIHWSPQEKSHQQLKKKKLLCNNYRMQMLWMAVSQKHEQTWELIK